MNQSKRWVWSASRASFIGVAAASVLLGGCSLLFENGSTSEDDGPRDDSGLSVDSGTTGDGSPGGDSGGGADGSQIADARVPVIDGSAVDAAVMMDDAGNPLVMVTFIVICPNLSKVDGLACECKLTNSQGGSDVKTLSPGTKNCFLNGMSGIDFVFTAKTTKTVPNTTEMCDDFTWSVTSGGSTIACSSASECMAMVSSPSTVTAECAEIFFFPLED